MRAGTNRAQGMVDSQVPVIGRYQDFSSTTGVEQQPSAGSKTAPATEGTVCTVIDSQSGFPCIRLMGSPDRLVV
jgi:hypothetical protein